MDKNLFLNILKNLTEKMYCPGCGKPYNIKELRFLGNSEKQYLVQISCAECNMPVMVNILADKPELKPVGQVLEDFEEITADDIISFHQEVKAFDGDFKKAFGL